MAEKEEESSNETGTVETDKALKAFKVKLKIRFTTNLNFVFRQLTRMEAVTLTKWSFSALQGMAYNNILWIIIRWLFAT